MHLSKKMFARNILLSVLITLLGFAILGTMIIFISGHSWKSEKRDILSKNAQIIENLISQTALLEKRNHTLYFNREDLSMLESVMTTISTGMTADIFIVNESGQVLISSSSSLEALLPHQAVKKAMKDSYFEVSTLDGFFDTKHYISAVPIEVETTLMQREVVGAVFCISSTSDYTDYRSKMIKTFLFACFITFIVIILAEAYKTYKTVKPLKQMSKAALKFGQGDFSTRINEDTYEEIASLAHAFNEMAQSLCVSEGIRRNFIANVSHELKTPMTSISGFVDGILDGTIPPEREKHYLSIVSSETKRLSRLINTMRELARIDSGEFKLKYTSFDISDIIINIFMTFEQKIENKQLEIRGLDEIEKTVIEADRDVIYQVIYNIVENAVKFSNQSGYIEVKLFKDKANCFIELKNSGHGIVSEEIKYIFDKFYKTDKSRSVDKNGIGLGLYIVKTMLRQHGGDISAMSILDEYTSFRFFLPIKEKI